MQCESGDTVLSYAQYIVLSLERRHLSTTANQRDRFGKLNSDWSTVKLDRPSELDVLPNADS